MNTALATGWGFTGAFSPALAFLTSLDSYSQMKAAILIFSSDGQGSVGWVSSCRTRRCLFNQGTWEATDQCFSLAPLFLSLFLLPFPTKNT